jgi:hypothetical protein
MITIKKVTVTSKIAKGREVILGDTLGTPEKTKAVKGRIKKGSTDIDPIDLDVLSGVLDIKIGKRHPKSTDEGLEFRRKQITRLLLRGVPKQTIAQHLKIGLTTLYRDISAINDEMKREVSNIDLPLFVGMTIAFYDEVRNIALRMATDSNEKDNRTKLNSLKVALDAESDKHRYLSLTGLYGEVVKQSELYGKPRGDHTLDHDDLGDFKNFISNCLPQISSVGAENEEG